MEGEWRRGEGGGEWHITNTHRDRVCAHKRTCLERIDRVLDGCVACNEEVEVHGEGRGRAEPLSNTHLTLDLCGAQLCNARPVGLREEDLKAEKERIRGACV